MSFYILDELILGGARPGAHDEPHGHPPSTLTVRALTRSQHRHGLLSAWSQSACNRARFSRDMKTAARTCTATRRRRRCRSSASSARSACPSARRRRRGLPPRQAPGHGLRDDHRPRHDRRRRSTIADRPDVFVSEERPRGSSGEPQAVHILCFGITPDDHEWLQAHADDVEAVAAYLHEHEIACALAHPFYAVEAPLTPRHRRRLAAAVRRLGGAQRLPRAASSTSRPRSTSRPTAAPASAAPTTTPASTSAARGRRRPRAATPEEFLAHIRARARERARRAGLGGQVGARGDGAWRSARSAADRTTPLPIRPPCCGWSSA